MFDIRRKGAKVKRYMIQKVRNKEEDVFSKEVGLRRNKIRYEDSKWSKCRTLDFFRCKLTIVFIGNIILDTC